MTNREKMMSVFMDALSSVLPGNLVRDILKYEGGGLAMAGEIPRQRISALSADVFFIYVLSGGSSALIEKPAPPITLAEMQGLTKGLLANGVPIGEPKIGRNALPPAKGGG